MTVVNLRLVNGLCVAMVGVVGVSLSVMEVEISALDPSLYLLGVAAGALIYISACLVEPAFVRRLHRRSSPYPSAVERLKNLGAFYPGAEQLYHKLKKEIEEKEPGKTRASRRKKRLKLFQTIGKGQ